MLDDRLPRSRRLLVLVLHVHLAFVRAVPIVGGSALALHDHRGHLLLRDRHILDFGETHRRRQLRDARLVVLGELDRRGDLEVLPVYLGKGDPLGLGLVLLLFPPAGLPLLPFDAFAGIL